MSKKSTYPRVLTLALALVFLLISPAEAKNYGDIQGHWAELNMARGIELGWIRGYEDGQVRPQATMTRAEFVALICQSLDDSLVLDQTMDSQYEDIASLPWAEANFRQAEGLGLLPFAFKGDQILPGDPISREEAAGLLDYRMVLDRALNREDLSQEEAIDLVKEVMEEKAELDYDPANLAFYDRDEVQAHLVSSVKDLTGQAIITGYEDQSFRPQGQLTRAEAMTLLVKAFNEIPTTPQVTTIEIQAVQGGFQALDPATGQALRRSQFPGGLIETQDNLYLLNMEGLLDGDYYKKDHKIYYIDGEKGLARGWKQVGNKLHYFSPLDHRMYKNGVFSTGEGVYWFDSQGAVKEGYRPGGRRGTKVYWYYPPAEEISNRWLEGKNQELRFRGQEMVNFTASFEGLPFKWYGTDLRNGQGVYCCGTTYSTYKEFGIHIPGPNDVQMRKHRGYEMVRAQYQDAHKFGGFRYPRNFAQAWPGDLIFNYSPNFYLGFNHVALFMGHNHGRPICIHATLANGLMIEGAYDMNRRMGRNFNQYFVRYNTEANPGNGMVPTVYNR
ncbi:MAG: S-layer homology domain-containing protein [Tissierellia bacterium]|nr:S-layer homology domain-containing protein [Tissierellia bacterium]